MPTSPLESLLHRDISRVSAKEILEKASPLLQELVNYATNAFMRCRTSEPDDDNLAVLTLYLHVIEMIDGVEVLVSQTCSVPATPLLRSAFEALLAMEYILETKADYVRRSRSWRYGDLHNQLAYCEQLDPTSQRGQQFQRVRSTDSVTANMSLPDQTQVQAITARINQWLADPKYRAIQTEYERTKRHDNGRKPEWYHLFNGPRKLRDLAQHLHKEGLYMVVYSQWSAISHATDASRFKIGTTAGDLTVKPLRHPTDIQAVAGLAAGFMLRATRLTMEKFRPDEDVAAWYIKEVRENFWHISQNY